MCSQEFPALSGRHCGVRLGPNKLQAVSRTTPVPGKVNDAAEGLATASEGSHEARCSGP